MTRLLCPKSAAARFALYCALFTVVVSATQAETVPADSSDAFRVRIGLEGSARVLQSKDAKVIVILDDASQLPTGFDFRFGFDAAALKFVTVDPGPLLINDRWEHFEYTLGDTAKCDSGCPSGVLRVSGDFRTSDERYYQASKTSANLSAILPAKLFTILFQATSDRTYDGVTVPIEFCWADCDDNLIRYITDGSQSGEHRAVASRLLSPWPDRDQRASSRQPHYCYGMPDDCSSDEADGAATTHRLIDFVNGYVTIGADYFIDARGDLDFNGIEYENSDLALFLDYFETGRKAFFINVHGQVAASDANRDGHTLSSSDFVYLWRQVHNQAEPDYLLRVDTAICTIHNRVISADKPMQAAQVVLHGESSYKLLLDGWETVYHFEDSVTRILVYDPSPEMSQTFEGEFLKVYGKVKSIDMSTQDGAWVDVTVEVE